MAGFSDFEIQVDNFAPAGWTTISDPTNLWTKFFRAPGLAVNTDPSSAFFGTIYVSHSRNGVQTGGANVRFNDAGIYSLSADLVGVDLSTFEAETDPNDPTLAHRPGFSAGQDLAAPFASPWRISLDEAGNVLVSDWSDETGGIKYASADLTSGGLILDTEDEVDPIRWTTRRVV
jgi:hypothetical protein